MAAFQPLFGFFDRETADRFAGAARGVGRADEAALLEAALWPSTGRFTGAAPAGAAPAGARLVDAALAGVTVAAVEPAAAKCLPR